MIKKLEYLEIWIGERPKLLKLFGFLYNVLQWILSLFQFLTITHYIYSKKLRFSNRVFAAKAASILNQGDRIETYRKHSPSVTDKNGFIEHHSCDSLLFSSLYWAAGMKVDIKLAMDPDQPGRWFRRSKMYPQCYPKYSKSTISRDMLTGLITGAIFRDDFDVLLNIYKYGLKNQWVMGEGALSRVLLGNNLENLLATCLTSKKFDRKFNKLGKSLKFRIKLSLLKPVVYGKDLKGYQAHLQFLQVIVRLVATKKFTLKDISAVGNQKNSSFAAMLLAYMLKTSIQESNTVSPNYLLNVFEEWCNFMFPVEGLPTAANRESRWMWEMNESDYPNPEKDVLHSGGDLLFFHKVLSKLAFE